MSTQHTPGPWSIQRNETPSDTSVGSAKDGYRFEIWNTEIKRTGTRWNNRRIALCNSYENAQLIAAAPELLEQLKLAHRMLLQTNWIHEDEAMNDLLAVIRKAEGI